MSEIVKKGDWVKFVTYSNTYSLLTEGKSYMVLEEPSIVNEYGIKFNAIIIRNDIGHCHRYLLNCFELDIPKKRNEVINEILM